MALTFPSDYDKENPLTSGKGKIRLLELQIEKARESGDEDVIKMLEAQKQQAANFTALQQMQAYTMQNMARQ